MTDPTTHDDTNDLAPEGVAIIGMVGRFPGADTLEQFWHNLRQGVESVTFFSRDQLLAAGVPEVAVDDPAYVPAAGVLSGIDLFDAGYFGYTPRDAELLDPQHRLFLEASVQALEQAGYAARAPELRVGVFAGTSYSSYLAALFGDPARRAALDSFALTIANDKDFLATRVAYHLDLTGPAYTVQTACSTALVAVHLACQSLATGESDLALAGGVSIGVPQTAGYWYQPGGILSPDGHCRAFSAQAQGTLRGSGLGVVVLRRLSEAIEAGDTIYAVIRGTALANDGHRKVGFTAPSVSGQATAIGEALAVADVAPETVGYVEAHGSGTLLGDPIEVAALSQAFGPGRTGQPWCALGSVKTNIGHLDAAAGVAGLIKTVLALQHRQLPPSLHGDPPNPEIDFASTPFFVNTTLRDWPRGTGPRRAGVSSFGIGGTNAHVVLEEAPPIPPPTAGAPWQMLPISAKSATALDALGAALAAHLGEHPEIGLADAAYTLQVGRQQHAYRLAVVCDSHASAVAGLSQPTQQRVYRQIAPDQPRPIAFLLPGIGDHYQGMGAGLYRESAVFRQAVDRCSELLWPLIGRDLRAFLFPLQPSDQPVEPALDLRALVRRSQPAGGDPVLVHSGVFVVAYALAQHLAALGIRPQAMLGYSLGEYAAACLAGVLSLEDALFLVVRRARLLARAPAGAMLAVALPAEQLAPLLPPEVALAVLATPQLSVVAGPPEALTALERELAARAVVARPVATGQAIHTPAMEAILPEFMAELRQVRLQPPHTPYVSNVTGTWISPVEATDPAYWGRHLCQPVRFAEALQTLAAGRAVTLLEVGPGHTLSTFALQTLDADTGRPLALATLRPAYDHTPDTAFLLQTIAQLWTEGHTIDWEALHAPVRPRRVPLPSYPFERQRYWMDARPALAQPRASASQRNPDLAQWGYLPVWQQFPLLGNGRAAPQETWLVFGSPGGLTDRIAEQLAGAGQTIVRIWAGEGFAQIDAQTYQLDPTGPDACVVLFQVLREHGLHFTNLLYGWGIEPPAQPPAAALGAPLNDFLLLLTLVQALERSGVYHACQITALTDRQHLVSGSEQLRPEQALFSGLCAVIPQEYPHLACRIIDLSLPEASGPQVARMLARLCLAPPAEHHIALRGLMPWVQRFQSAALPPLADTAPLRLRGVYMITGGYGRIGLALAKQLAESVQARLALVGRTALPDRQHWDMWLAQHGDNDRQSQIIRQVRQLEALGAEVLVISADVTDRDAMRAALQQISQRFGALNGVVHAAGLLGGATFQAIQSLNAEECSRQFAPKVNGVLVLREILGGQQLDFCMLTSSIATVLGGLGFAAYAAANSFMDAFAAQQSGRQTYPWLSVNWDSWRFSQSERNTGKLGASLQELWMSPEEGSEIFLRTLALGAARVVISTGDLAARIAQWVQLRSLAPEQPRDHPAQLYTRPQIRTPYAAPAGPVEQRLAQLWQELLGIADVGRHDSFFELGGDSLLAIRIVARANELGLQLNIQEFIAHPTIAELVALGIQNPAQPDMAAAHQEHAAAMVVGIGDDKHTHGVPLTPNQHMSFETHDPDRHIWNNVLYVEVAEPMNPAHLAEAARVVIGHHEGLRLRSMFQGHQWHQQIAPPDEPVPFVHCVLAGQPWPMQRPELEARINELQASLDISAGPLLRLALFDLGPGQPQRLLIIVHHTVADGYSTTLLWQDLLAVYNQLRHGQPPQLPPKTTSLRRYAEWLVAEGQTSQTRTELGYWLAPERQQVALLPKDFPQGVHTGASARDLEVALSVAETRQLLELAGRQWPTVELLLTALVQAFAGWSGQPQLLVDLEHHGRDGLPEGIDLSRTIGWINYLTPVLLRPEGDTAQEQVRSIQRQLQDLPRRGLGYGLLRYLSPDPEVRLRMQAMPQPQVLFNYRGQFRRPNLAAFGVLRPASESVGQTYSMRVIRRHLLMINGQIADSQLRFTWTYGSAVYRHSTIEHLAGRFIAALRELIRVGTAELIEKAARHDTKTQVQPVSGDALHQPAVALLNHPIVTGPVPLMPGQHWFLDSEPENPHFWNIAMMLEIDQPVDPVLFAEAIRHVLVHHDVLRARFVREPDGWRQLFAPPETDPLPFAFFDFTALPESEQRAAVEAECAQLQPSLNITSGPVFRIALFALGGDHPSRLLIITHHLITDGVSVGLILEDLQTAYIQLSQGQPVVLPPKTASMRDLAQAVQEHSQSPRLRQMLERWLDQPWERVAPLPVDLPAGLETNSFRSTRGVGLQLSPEETHTLIHQVPEASNVQVMELLLVALGFACAAWVGEEVIQIEVLGHGRLLPFIDLDLSRTVGLVVTGDLMLLDLRGVRSPLDAFERILPQLRSGASMNRGTASLLADPELREKIRSLPKREMFLNYHGRTQESGAATPLRRAREHIGLTESPESNRGFLLAWSIWITHGQLMLHLGYSSEVHHAATIERLAQSYMEALRVLTRLGETS